ncbi:uncharacterized protein L201_003709 [Kwoniella dendrophila CBS 6074]|uniref:Uncharacterized protein n=1 Tax=Kwoniella dendrophila CBS 6074 TaxID=1295534 RepID=A0AAX4JTN9_9TREE
MITYAPKTFNISRLASLCRQTARQPGLSSSTYARELHHQPIITTKTFTYKPQFSEGVLRNKIERARLATLRRNGLL